ncbi:uncharacterized protein LOC132162318 [Corylus avellana]|uniref:uncharacterized protein LOC132162318 n=1 Tax=Corylus avellana TaxID=13451 RepID=UPI00286D585B|nr:uncharacterized protein LOC132162318 [Corylus avellana]
MIVELNIFDINKQPLDYDEVRNVCLIEEITDEIVSQSSLEDPEVKCFTQDGEDLNLDKLFGILFEPSIEDPDIECFTLSRGDLDLDRLLEQVRTLYEPNIEDPEVESFAQYRGDMDLDRLLEPVKVVSESSLDPVLECFAQFGYDLDFDELVEQAEAPLDPIPEMQPENGETIEISFPNPYSIALEPLKLISESKWVRPIHVWPKWLGVTMGRKKNNQLFSTLVQTGWQGCIDYSKLKAITRKDHFPPPFIDQLVERLPGHPYYCVLNGYSSYNQVPLDPDEQENTTLTIPFGVFAYYRMSFGSCNALAVESLAEDCKLSACVPPIRCCISGHIGDNMSF